MWRSFNTRKLERRVGHSLATTAKLRISSQSTLTSPHLSSNLDICEHQTSVQPSPSLHPWTKLTMSLSRTAASKSFLSNLSIRPSLRPRAHPATQRQLRWQSEEGHPRPPPSSTGRSFKGQLYESTTRRLHREQAEQERFSLQRKEYAGGRNLALTFGTFVTSSFYLVHIFGLPGRREG